MNIQIEDLLNHSFVISIDDQRYQQFNLLFKNENLLPLPQLYAGFKVDGIPYNGLENNKFQNRGVANLLYTNLSIIKLAKYLNWPYVGIFEDDAYPCKECNKYLNNVLSNIPDNCNVLVLGWSSLHGQYKNNIKYINIHSIWGSQANVIFSKAYDELIENVENKQLAIDDYIGTHNYIYASSKYLFAQYNDKASDISKCTGYIYDSTLYESRNDFFKDFYPIEHYNEKIRKTLPMRDLRHQQFIDGLKDFCRAFEKYSSLTMLEIGVFKGESTKIFKDSGIFSKQYCVDPWDPSIDTKDGMNYSDAIQAEEEFHRQFDNDKNIVPVKGTIDTFIQNFKNTSIDVVYVDGAHNYESVKNDILKIMQYVKPKVAICGHDYNDPEYSLEMDQPGVRQAIEETLGIPDRKFLDTSWIKWVDTHKKINEIELDYDFLMHNAQLINCKSDVDRLQLEKMIFEYHRLQFPNVFDAYTIADPGDASAANTSHKRIIQYAQKECLPYILIFEDDCYFINGIENEIKNAIAHVPDDTDILQFSYNYNNNSRKLEYNRIFNDQCTCIAMYIIFKKAYQKTIDLLDSGAWMDRLQCNLISYTLNKPICIQYNFNYSETRGTSYGYDIGNLNIHEQQTFNDRYPKIEDILKSHYSKFL